MRTALIALVGFLSLVSGASAGEYEGLWLKPSVHWVPVGMARSYREPAGIGKQNFVPFSLGATLFAARVDGGRLFLGGAGAGFALGGSNPESHWSGVLHLTCVPVAIRVRDRVYIAPTLGTAEIGGVKAPDWPLPFSWKGIKTVGLQVSVCLTACGD